MPIAPATTNVLTPPTNVLTPPTTAPGLQPAPRHRLFHLRVQRWLLFFSVFALPYLSNDLAIGASWGSDSGAGSRRLMVSTGITLQRGVGEFKGDIRVRWHEMHANK